MVENEKKPRKSRAKSSKKDTEKVQNPVKKTAKNAPKDAKKAQVKRKPARKGRTDSIENHVAVAQAAFHEVPPPDNVKLRKAELRFWDSIVDEFAKVEWTDHTLELAAMLTRNMYDLDLEQRKMRKEGSILDRNQIIPAVIDKNTGREIKPAKVVVISQYLNPRKTLIEMYTNNIIKLRRSLSLHARGKEGESRDIGKRRALAKSIEGSVKTTDEDDGLLATPQTIQ